MVGWQSRCNNLHIPRIQSLNDYYMYLPKSPIGCLYMYSWLCFMVVLYSSSFCILRCEFSPISTGALEPVQQVRQLPDQCLCQNGAQVHVCSCETRIWPVRDCMLFKMLCTVCRQLYDCHSLFAQTLPLECHQKH